MEAYNPKHPIGTKYTPQELKRRRDDWYAKVKNSQFVALDERHAEVDRKLLARLREVLSSYDAEYCFRDLDYGDRIPRKVFDLLLALRGFVDKVESQFLNPTLEGLFAEFRSRVHVLLNGGELGQTVDVDKGQTVDVDNNFHLIPRKYREAPLGEYDFYLEEYTKLRDRLNESAMQLYDAYARLIRECRRQLAVD